MPRKAIIEKSLANRGAIIVTRDLLEACKVADTISPEHLEISTENPETVGGSSSPRRRDLHGPLVC